MEDINQMHGSTQTNEFLSLGEYKDLIANKIGTKDLFPGTKKLLVHKNQKNKLEPLEILNKFRKKVFGVSDFQKKLSFKAKKNQKKLNLVSPNANLALEVKKVFSSKAEKSLLSSKHTFFPKFSGGAENHKKTFLTDIKKSESKAKKLFFNKAKHEAPEGDTVYSSYILKDFECPNKNDYDTNLNHNSFHVLFNKEKKFFKDKKFDAKNFAEFEKEKKQMHKIERRIQTEFLQKISFPPNEKFMNKTANNFNFNKGLYKINDLRGSLTSADKIRSLVGKDKEKAAKGSLSPSYIRDFSSNNINDDFKFSNNFNEYRVNFHKQSSDNFNFTARNFHKKKFNINDFNNYSSENNLIKKNNIINSKSPNRRENRGNTSEAHTRLNHYFNKNEHALGDIKKLYKTKNYMGNWKEIEPLSYNRINNQNFNAQTGIFGGSNSPKKEFNSYDNSDSLEKKLYTFNLNQGSNAHVLHMLRLNQKQEKLGLTKRTNLGPSTGLNEKLLREKLKNNLDGIVKRQQNFFNTNNNFNNKNRNELANNNNGLAYNITFHTHNIEKSKYVKINKNLFESKEIPDEENKYYVNKRGNNYSEKAFDKNRNSNNYNNIDKKSNSSDSGSKNPEKYSSVLDEEKSNINFDAYINDSSLNNNNNNNFAEKIEAINSDYENKTEFNKNENKNKENQHNEGNLNLRSNANEDHENNLFEEKCENSKKKSKETNDFLSSPCASMEQIISKKTFENLNENLNINITESNINKNEDLGNNYKKSLTLKANQTSNKNGSSSLIKNYKNIDDKKAYGVKTSLLLNKQANNKDLVGLQVEEQ